MTIQMEIVMTAWSSQKIYSIVTSHFAPPATYLDFALYLCEAVNFVKLETIVKYEVDDDSN
jgi:hypothetical protein